MNTEFRYERLRARWRFWRERFRLADDYWYRIPDSFQAMVQGEVDAGPLQIRMRGGKWYLFGRAGYRWDGATWVLTTDCVVLASYLHDAFYDFVAVVAREWGVKRSYVRGLGDLLFRYKLDKQRSWARRIYPFAVERVGGVWNEIGLLFRKIGDL